MMRREILIGLISSVVTLSGCATPPPSPTGTGGALTRSDPPDAEKQAAFEKLLREQAQKRAALAEAEKNFNAMRAEKQKSEEEVAAKRAAELDVWIQKYRGYLLQLCDTAPGSDHADAWDAYNLAVSSDTRRAAEAQGAQKHVIDCDKLRNSTETPAPGTTSERTSSVRWRGYTWSNARRSLVGFTWSNARREVRA